MMADLSREIIRFEWRRRLARYARMPLFKKGIFNEIQAIDEENAESHDGQKAHDEGDEGQGKKQEVLI